jgi:cell wall-associated NlpC family hydrolase
MSHLRYCIIIASLTYSFPLYPTLRIITAPVTDLRIANWKPSKNSPSGDSKTLRASQLLFNEIFKPLKSETDIQGNVWLYGYALEQKDYSNNKEKPLSGWVQAQDTTRYTNTKNLVINQAFSTIYSSPEKSSDAALHKVTFGTTFQGLPYNNLWYKVMLPEGNVGYIPASNLTNLDDIKSLPHKEIRKIIVANAKHFIGSPYLWGGRSMHQSNLDYPTSVDCSALINLLYQERGIIVPRSSTWQYAYAKKIKASELKPADLIFLAGENAGTQMRHVMLYEGDGKFIEASGITNIVHSVALRDVLPKKLAAHFESIQNGDLIKITWTPDDARTYHIYFGSYLNS